MLILVNTSLGQIFAGRNFREFSRFCVFFQEIRENFSHEKYFLPPFVKINPREKLEIGQFAKLNLYAAEKWRNTSVKFWKIKNLRIAKLNPREKWVMIKFAKLNPREIKKIREFLSSRKFLLAKIFLNKVVVRSKGRQGSVSSSLP